MATFGRDTPMARPNPGGRAAVFVPSEVADETLLETIKPASGMVGFGNPDGSVTIYFESNKFNDPDLFKWDRKIIKAYDRMVRMAPTVNKLTCDAENLEQIGFIEAASLTVRKVEGLTRWLTQSNAMESMPETPVIDFNKK